MLPTIREKRDSVFLENPDSLKVGDIVLYKRKNEKFILHRIVGEQDGRYIMCGDNQIDYEYGIERDQIIAVAAAIFRDDRYYDRQSRQYYPSLYCRFLTLARRTKRRLKGQKMQ